MGQGHGILAQFDPAKPLDEAQLQRYCDTDDSSACFLLGKSVDLPDRLPIVQGMAPTGKAIFAALIPQDKKISWFLFEEGATALKPLSIAQTHTHPGSPFRIEQVQAQELLPQKTYGLLAVEANGMLLDHRTFRTFEPQSPFRFALFSGSNDAFLLEQAAQWEDMAAQNPQLILSLGANVYANSRGSEDLGATVSPNTLWERHAETRNALAIFKNPQLIPFFVTWNHQDFGQRNGDNTYPYLNESRKILEAFFPCAADNKSILEGPGISRALRIAEHTFIFFDNRSFRSPNALPPACQRQRKMPICHGTSAVKEEEATHFGRVQEDWAASLVKNSNGPVWLASGDSWFGKYHPYESFEGNHPTNFSAFLEKLKDATKTSAPKNLVFLSGGLPLYEIIKVQPFASYQTYELTTAGLHDELNPTLWKKFSSSRKVSLIPDAIHYALVSTSLDKNGNLLLATETRSLGKTLLQKELKIKPSRATR